MSEPKLISPLLDGFSMGNPISEHNGIRCCPAIKENTDKKYIVKIIAVPASQIQMDALLLTGAYKDPSEAMDYFRAKGEDILKEAQLLKKLSKLEGFLSYEGWQMEPITRHRLGYEIYLVGSYKRSLDKYMRHNAVTHLEAINLGLDICSALTVCRQAGALYVNLKPSNIFMSEKKEYRIGDLGFIDLDAMRYTALPDKYQSSYTPPELYDPMASLNMTVDTYGLGMLLYQLYNDGQLPFKGKAPEEALPTPVNADYELAEIIMKAIHPDPVQRWNDPAEMGKALASYMQRNTINDVPITPLKNLKKSKKIKKMEDPPQDEAAVCTDAAEAVISETTAADEAISEMESPTVEAPENAVSEEPDKTEISQNDQTPIDEQVADMPNPSGESDLHVDIPDEDIPEPTDDLISEDPSTSEMRDCDVTDEPQVSGELAIILEKADELIAHDVPEDIVIPEEPDPFAFATEDSDEPDDSDIPYDPLMEEEPHDQGKKKKKEKKFADPKYKRRKKRLVSFLIAMVLLAAIGIAGFWYYLNIYLQTIDNISIDGSQEQLTVTVDSDIKEGLLYVTCMDNYGKAERIPLKNGQAVFTNLESNTMYTIQLSISGFHDLVGKTSDIFTTEATTSIVSFTSVAGAEDGSVILNFTVDGEEPDQWTLFYTADGEEEKREYFTGHTVTVTGLSIGKVYTFTLDAGQHLTLNGEKSLELMATRLILAQNLTVSSSGGNDMTVHWDTPGDVVVDSWDVRCYNNRGYNEQLTVTDTEVLFTGIDPANEYTVEVIASGMTQPARTGITANPINVSTFDVDPSVNNKLKVTWEHSGSAPDGGWLLMYSIDGSENYVVKCGKASTSITPRIPGANYTFTIQAADGTSIFNNVYSYTVPKADALDMNALSAQMLTVDLLKTPEDENWHYENISDEVLTTQFTVGDPISVVLRSSDSFYLPGSEVNILYVIRDSYGNVLSHLISEEEVVWKKIWTGGDAKNGELDIPKVPASAGEYVLNLYFDGMTVAEIPFTIAN